jgi:hypothetical protein
MGFVAFLLLLDLLGFCVLGLFCIYLYCKVCDL